jgi:hypothetical protein
LSRNPARFAPHLEFNMIDYTPELPVLDEALTALLGA